MGSFISPYMIVVASIDRYCASSTNGEIRKFSSVQVSKWVIGSVITVLSLFFINVLVMINIQPTKGFICLLQADTIYSHVYVITQVFLYAAIPPILMMFFGLMTI